MASAVARDYDFGDSSQPHQSTFATARDAAGLAYASPESMNDYEEDETRDMLSPSSTTTTTTPPYWVTPRTHQRTNSNISAESLPVGAITLQDNENSEDNDRNNACWAKSVEIIDHTVINGSATNIGAFVVWIIQVETLTVGGPSQGRVPAHQD
jgi:hypothetical protein